MVETTNLVAYYKLDENAANTDVVDAHSTHDGTASTNTSNLSVVGIINTGFEFNGTNEYVDLGSMGTIGSDWPSGGAVSFWVKTTTSDSEVIMGEITESGSDDPFFQILTNNRDTGGITLAIRDNDGGAQTTIVYTSDNNLINTGSYVHVVITWTDLTDDSTIKIYVNGNDKALSDDGTAFNGAMDNFGGFAIGAVNSRGTPGSWFDGTLDEMAFFDANLSAQDVADLYNSGSGLAYPFTAVGTNISINIGDAWKDVAEMKINIGDVWKDVVQVQINIGDAWKTVFG